MGGTQAAPGIHSRAADLLFTCLAESGAGESATVELAMMEIYCDQVRDLLADNPQARLDISGLGAAQLPRFQERVPGLSWRCVASSADALVRLTQADLPCNI